MMIRPEKNMKKAKQTRVATSVSCDIIENVVFHSLRANENAQPLCLVDDGTRVNSF